jgi:CRISPR-associated protein Cas2
MWILVMFDLPTTTAARRKAASQFRVALRRAGFEQMQRSVYRRECQSQEVAARRMRDVVRVLPPYGVVDMMALTAAQHAAVARFVDGVVTTPRAESTRIVMF